MGTPGSRRRRRRRPHTGPRFSHVAIRRSAAGSPGATVDRVGPRGSHGLEALARVAQDRIVVVEQSGQKDEVRSVPALDRRNGIGKLLGGVVAGDQQRIWRGILGWNGEVEPRVGGVAEERRATNAHRGPYGVEQRVLCRRQTQRPDRALGALGRGGPGTYEVSGTLGN